MVKRILIAANSDLRFDRRLQRIACSLRKGGYATDLVGRAFGSRLANVSEHERHLSLWFQKGKLAYIELNIRLFFFLIGQKTDAICSVDLDTLPACRLAAGILKCKLVQDSHEYMAEVPEVAGRLITKAVWHRIAQWFLPSCHLRYTTSHSLVEEFRRLYKTEFSLIRNMPPLQNESTLNPMPPGFPERDFLVYLGAVNQGRGLEEVLEVLVERDENLVIIGEGDKSDVIEKLIVQYGLSQRVFRTGKLLPSELFQILVHARAGINILRDEGLSYRYSLANKFFDYVHAGIPQVCIDFPEYRNLMAEYDVGILCALSKSSLHAAFDKLRDPEHVTHMRHQTESAKMVWNWQEEEKKLICLYAGLFS